MCTTRGKLEFRTTVPVKSWLPGRGCGPGVLGRGRTQHGYPCRLNISERFRVTTVRPNTVKLVGFAPNSDRSAATVRRSHVDELRTVAGLAEGHREAIFQRTPFAFLLNFCLHSAT